MARKTPVHSGYTIINGTATGINADLVDVWVEYSVGQSNVEGNYTPFTAYFYAAANYDGLNTSGVSGLKSTFSVDGVAGTGVSNGSYDFRSTSKTNLLGSYSGNIAHNADGTKVVSISGSFTTPSEYISGGSIKATIALGTVESGFVYIYTGTSFEKFVPYIDNGTTWERYLPFIYEDGEWKRCS